MICDWLRSCCGKKDGSSNTAERLKEMKDELVEEHVTNNSGELAKLDLSDCVAVSDATLAVLQRECAASLQQLDLEGTQILTAGSILSLSTHCEKLPLGTGIVLPGGKDAKVPDMLETWLMSLVSRVS